MAGPSAEHLEHRYPTAAHLYTLHRDGPALAWNTTPQSRPPARLATPPSSPECRAPLRPAPAGRSGVDARDDCIAAAICKVETVFQLAYAIAVFQIHSVSLPLLGTS